LVVKKSTPFVNITSPTNGRRFGHDLLLPTLQLAVSGGPT